MRITSIELHTACQVSTPLLDACAREGIPVLLATPRRGGLALHAHLRRSVESYRDAPQESALADWTPNILSARLESADDRVADGGGRSPEVFGGEESDAMP